MPMTDTEVGVELGNILGPSGKEGVRQGYLSGRGPSALWVVKNEEGKFGFLDQIKCIFQYIPSSMQVATIWWKSFKNLWM